MSLTPLPGGAMVHLECGHSAKNASTIGALIDCIDCDHHQLPAAVRPGRRTPVFDYESVPEGLLREHRTSVWARLVVLVGAVHFRDSAEDWHVTATTSKSKVIVPDRPHEIQVEPGAQFYVQFYDLPSSSYTADRI